MWCPVTGMALGTYIPRRGEPLIFWRLSSGLLKLTANCEFNIFLRTSPMVDEKFCRTSPAWATSFSVSVGGTESFGFPSLSAPSTGHAGSLMHSTACSHLPASTTWRSLVGDTTATSLGFAAAAGLNCSLQPYPGGRGAPTRWSLMPSGGAVRLLHRCQEIPAFRQANDHLADGLPTKLQRFISGLMTMRR